MPIVQLLSLTLAALCAPASLAPVVVGALRAESAHLSTASPLFVRMGEELTLVALRGDGGSEEVAARLGELSGEQAGALRWYLAQAVAADYDNAAFCAPGSTPGCHAPLTYAEHELTQLRGRSRFALSVAAELSALGTHRLAARLVDPREAPRPAPSEVAVAAMFEVVVRRDDTYVGYLTELMGVPFVLWPRLLNTGHQTDLRLGADCVALVIYGRRRLGEPMPYVAPSALRAYTREVLAPALLGAHYARAGAAIQVGDILHFGFQTAVLSDDRPPLGRLNPEDRVMQTYHGLAEERSLAELPYRGFPVRVLRWPSAGPHAALPPPRFHSTQ